MTRQFLCQVWVVTLFTTGSTAAFGQKAESVALMPLQAKKVPKDTVAVLDELLAVALDEFGPYKVISPKDINSMLGRERMKETLGCDDETRPQLGLLLGRA